MKYRFTKKARKQLDAITYYIAQDNERAAERVYEAILETCQLVADMPGIGSNPPYLSDSNIRRVSVKKYRHYQVFYREQRKEIAILWVFHGARDIPALIDDR